MGEHTGYKVIMDLLLIELADHDGAFVQFGLNNASI